MLLGLVQGVAEVAPVSSSAQLTAVPLLLHWDDDAVDEPRLDRTTAAAALHAGSCLGLTWALREELRGLRPAELVGLLAVSAPAALAGLLAGAQVERRLGTPRQLAALLAAGGAAMWLADEYGAHSPSAVDGRGAPGAGGPSLLGVPRTTALVAASAQVLALAPGVSRSGATLTALRLRGVDRASAHRYALLTSLPITAGAAGLSLLRADRRAVARQAAELVVGAAASAAAAALTSRVWRAETPLAAPAIYRLGVAAAVAHRVRTQRKS